MLSGQRPAHCRDWSAASPQSAQQSVLPGISFVMMTLVILRQLGLSFPSSERKYLDAFETSRQAVKVFLEGRDIWGSRTDYLNEMTLAWTVCGKAVDSE